MKRTSPATPPTIQELISSRIKERNLSRPQFIQAIGYTNIPKGLRRFDTFRKTLEYPNDDFLRNILTVLEIDGLSFYQSFMLSKDIIAQNTDDSAKSTFIPHLEVLADDEPSPWFAAQYFYFQRRVTVPLELQSLPITEELNAVLSIYKEHVLSITADNPARIKMIYGFKYHRQHNYYLHFDIDCVLRRVQFVTADHPGPKKELGDQVLDIMSDHLGVR